MVKRSEKFYPIDYTELKRQLDAELNRRGKSEGTGQGQSVGSVSAHIQNYSAVPESGAYIVAEHIQKITNPLSAITGSSITPENGSKVAADVLSKAAAVLSQLSAVPENAASPVRWQTAPAYRGTFCSQPVRGSRPPFPQYAALRCR